MTEQERYLITFLNETFGHHESDIDSEAFAKRLIQRYPQILAEKVWEGDVGTIFANGKCVYQTEFFDMPNKEWKNHLKKVQLFIREVVDA